MSEVQKLSEEIKKAVADFQKANDDRLAKLEKGINDRVGQDQVEKLNAEISRLEAEMTKANRPAQAAQGDEDQAQHRKAFGEWVRKGVVGPALLKAVTSNVGTDSQGGYLVPAELDKDIVEYERRNSPMRGLCTVRTVGSEKFERPVNQQGATSGWVGEQETRAQTEAPLFGMVQPSFGTIYAEPHVTQNMLDDAFLDMEGFLAEQVGREFAEEENAAFMTGNGVKKPRGLLHSLSTAADGSRAFGSIQNMNSGTSGGFDGDDLLTLIHSLHRGYRQNAKLMMTNLTVAYVRKLKDGEDNYLWRPGLEAGQPSTLLGYAIEENDDVADVGADANAVIFGDLKRAYEIFDIKGVRMLRDDLTTKGKVKLYTWKRVGGAVVDDRAVKVLTLSA